jgi:hypothetical protein
LIGKPLEKRGLENTENGGGVIIIIIIKLILEKVVFGTAGGLFYM